MNGDEFETGDTRVAIAQALRDLGVRGILVTAAEQGKLAEVRCAMRPCYHPEEAGGETHFEPTFAIDWMPTMDHIDLKSEGGIRSMENSRLAHRLCNRVSFATRDGNDPSPRELRRIEAWRQRAIPGA